GTRRVMDDRLGDGAEQKALPAAITVRADDDQVGAEFLRGLDDAALWGTEKDLASHIEIFADALELFTGFLEDLGGVFTGGLFHLGSIGKVAAVNIDRHWHRHVDDSDDLRLIARDERKTLEHI